MRRVLLLVAALVAQVSAGRAASEGDEAPAAPPPVRPVLSIVVAPAADLVQSFAGTVEPRYQADLGFQVLGRIQDFYVEVGDLVRSGERLATLDPTPFVLDVRAREADLAQAKARAENAAAELDRTRRLTERNVEPAAELEVAVRDRDVADAAVRQAEAELAKSREQLGYATLAAETDGVVTAKLADVGDTVAAGERVLTVARTDVREAVLDLPEPMVRAVTAGTPFRVALQADPTVKAEAKVREIAPQADAATRTRRVRATLQSPPQAFRLGATITAVPEMDPPAGQVIDIPRSAVLDADGGGEPRVFIVDEAARAVRAVPVTLAPGEGATARVLSGLTPGQRVVTAGVHGLSDGQEIRIDEEAPR